MRPPSRAQHSKPSPAPGGGENLADLFAGFGTSTGLLLAVSGGPDSTALLVLVDRWRKASAMPVFVATVDHALRATSRAEAEDVGALCAARGLPHRILTWSGDKPGTGMPAAARAARYRLLGEHAREIGADTIVTAHHADDQAETVLMRLTRGSGPAGLAGMARLSPAPWPGGEGLSLARPLLGMTKAELVAICRDEGLGFVEDPTNADEAYRRPQLRKLAAALAAEGLGRDELNRLAARAARAEEALAPAVAAMIAALPARRESELFEVPAAAFLPPPAVDSAVILCTKRTQPPVAVPSEKLFFRVVRAAFGQRRKTLANSLQGGGFAREEVAAMLQETGIKGERRGETLSLDEFAALSRSYARNRKEGVSDET